MKVLVVGNAHLYKTPDGKYYTPTIYSYEFFERYLQVFEKVRFVAKTKYVENIDESKFLLVSGENLEIHELPWYQGMKEMLRKIAPLISRYKKACIGCDCYIFRIAQIESYFTYIFRDEKSKPYAVEMVNDPATLTDMSKIALKINMALSKIIIKNANGVSYVTESYLQKLYPSKARKNGQCGKYFETYYSSIDLGVNDIKKPKKYTNTKKNFEIIHVSNAINSNIKGLKTFIETLKLINDRGYNVTGCCIGDGNKLNDFKKYSKVLKIYDKIEFTGRLNNKMEVLNRLSKSDMLVLPTFMEGLPRTVIEAMAVGLPCLSTPIAGIPELLQEKYLFDPKDSKGFSEEIVSLIENPIELEDMSMKNIETAKKYTNDKLTKRRNEFYINLREISE